MLSRFRCELCRQRCRTCPNLRLHYARKHGKIQIIKHLIRTRGPLKLPRPRKTPPKKTVELCKNVHVTYTNDTIVIEDENCSDHLIQLTVDRDLDLIKRPIRKQPKRKNKQTSNRNKKLLQIDIRREVVKMAPKSLDERNGRFYVCNCAERSHVESAKFECGTCSEGFDSEPELKEHSSSHGPRMECRACKEVFPVVKFKEHFQKNHMVYIYMCHFCGLQFVIKEVLKMHLQYHFEQQTLEDVLDMERDYNMYGYCNTNILSADHQTNIDNILLYLTYPYDHFYSRNVFMKVVCDICSKEFYLHEYERHVKNVHFVQI